MQDKTSGVKPVIRLGILKIGQNSMRVISSIQIGEEVHINTINKESFFGKPEKLGKKYGNLLKKIEIKEYKIINGEEISFENEIIPIKKHTIKTIELVSKDFIESFLLGLEKALNKKRKKPG